MTSNFVCTTCAGALVDWESFYECQDCASRYPVRGGVACFKPSEEYHGEIPRESMRRVLERAPVSGWRAAYEEALRDRTSRNEYVFDRKRARLVDLLPLSTSDRVLDFGCGLGAITVALAERVKEVVALDAVFERAAFVDLRCKQDGLPNVMACACADPLELPFPDEHFDVVVVNGVLEYIPLAVPGPLAQAQGKALEQLARVLRPGGRLWLAIENRWGTVYWTGWPDHNGLRFTSLLPRPVASAVERWKKGRPYRVATHGMPMYRRLLAGAGFRDIRFFWPAPLYQFPERFLSLDDREAVAAYLRQQAGRDGARARVKAAALRALHAAGLLKYAVPDYAIIAVKDAHASA